VALSVGTNGREILAELIYKPAISSSTRVPMGVSQSIRDHLQQAGFAAVRMTDLRQEHSQEWLCHKRANSQNRDENGTFL